MSAIKNYIYDKSIELAKKLGNPLLSDRVNDMVTYFITERNLSITDALKVVEMMFDYERVSFRHGTHKIHLV